MKYNKEILDRFLNEKVAIALRTEEEWDEFMGLLEEETDVKWQTGENPTEYNKWDKYGGDSAIACSDLQKTKLRFSSTGHYRGDYEIIEFKELVKENV